MNEKPLRASRYDRIERITCYQHDSVPVLRHYPLISGVCDGQSDHLVVPGMPVLSLNFDRIARPYRGQDLQMCIAVAADHTDTLCPRLRGSSDMPGSERQGLSAGAGQDDQVGAVVWQAEPGNRPGVGPWPGAHLYSARQCLFPGTVQQ